MGLSDRELKWMSLNASETGRVRVLAEEWGRWQEFGGWALAIIPLVSLLLASWGLAFFDYPTNPVLLLLTFGIIFGLLFGCKYGAARSEALCDIESRLRTSYRVKPVIRKLKFGEEEVTVEPAGGAF